MWKHQYTGSWAANSEHCSGRVHTRLNVTEFFFRVKHLAFRNFFCGLVPTISSVASSPTTRAQSSSTAHCVPTGHSVIKMGSWTSWDGAPVWQQLVRFLNSQEGRGPCVATTHYSARRDGALWGQNYVSAKFGLVGMACTDAAYWIDLTRWQKCQKWPI